MNPGADGCDKIMASVYRRLKELRRHLGLTQMEMAGRLKITQGWLSKLESGTAEMSVRHLLSLREHLNVSLEAFLNPDIPIAKVRSRKRARTFDGGAEVAYK